MYSWFENKRFPSFLIIVCQQRGTLAKIYLFKSTIEILDKGVIYVQS